MRSINQIRQDFEAFANAHDQINQFNWGELQELYSSKKHILHSVLNVALVSSVIRKQTVEYTLQISVGDLVDQDERNKDDVESDTHRIIRDVDTFLRSRQFRQYYFTNDVSSPSQYRIRVGSDYVFGWSLNLAFRVVDQKADCSVPLLGFDITSLPNQTACQRLLGVLTDGQKNSCILPTYDFSDAVNVQPNITSQQQTDLEDWLCTGGGDVEIYDTDGNLLYTVTAPASQTIQNSNAQLNVNGGATFKTETLLAEETKAIELTVHNTANDDVGSGIVFGGLIRIGDSTIQNSNGSYSVNLPAEDALILPNIDFTDSDGTTTSVPSMEDLVCTPAATPSGIAYQRPIYTGQTTSYATGDSAWRAANETQPTNPAYPAAYARLDWTAANPFLTLESNNAFGNLNRFTDENGLQVYGNNYVIDHLTGYGIGIITPSLSNWTSLFSVVSALTINGYSDYFVGNLNEVNSIMNLSQLDALNYSPLSLFGFAVGNDIWTGDTDPNTTTNAYTIQGQVGVGVGYNVRRLSKGSTNYYIPMRYHY